MFKRDPNYIPPEALLKLAQQPFPGGEFSPYPLLSMLENAAAAVDPLNGHMRKNGHSHHA